MEKAGTKVERATYTAAEVSSLIDLDKNRVYKLAAEGQLPCIRVGKRFLFPKAAIDRWLSQAGAKAVA